MIIILHVPAFPLLATVGYRPLIAINTVYEDGYRMVKGCQYTAATILGQPAPCNNPAIPIIPGGGVALGKLDISSIAGALRVLGANVVWTEQYRSFWDLIEYIGFHGMHNYPQMPQKVPSWRAWENIENLYAWRAWEDKHRPQVHSDKVTDVTDYVIEARHALDAILGRTNKELINLGYSLQQTEIELRGGTSVQEGSVILRETVFPLHRREMMYLPNVDVLITHDQKTGQIILSTAKPIGLNCLANMQTAGLKNPQGGKYLAYTDPGHTWDEAVEFLGTVAINATREVL